MIRYFRAKTDLDNFGYQGEKALTRREKEVLELAVQGLTNKEIADYLGRLNDLGPLEIVTIRSAAYDMLNEEPATAPETVGRPALTLIVGGAA